MVIATEPLLPPVARPRGDDTDAVDGETYNYDLQLGDIYVAVYNGSRGRPLHVALRQHRGPDVALGQQ